MDALAIANLVAKTLRKAGQARSVARVAQAIGLRLIAARSLIAGNLGQYRGTAIAFDATLSGNARDEVIAHEIGHHVAAIECLQLGDREEAFADAFGAALIAAVRPAREKCA
jgi:proline dehydrogenase